MSSSSSPHGALLLGAAALLAACGTGPLRGTVTTLDADTATLVDVHGRADVQAVPAACLVGADPHPTSDPSQQPEAMWLAINPASVRDALPLTGYRVWASPVPTSTQCPNSARTEIYNGLYRFDLTRQLGRSGALLRATARAYVQSTRVDPLFIPQPPLAPPDASRCDEASAGLAALWSVPPATALPTGVDVRFVNSMTPARLPLPGATRLAPWPQKQPTQRATGSSVRELSVDVTRVVLAALQAREAQGLNAGSPAGSAPMMFVMSGSNDPPAMKDAPLPFKDCRGATRLRLDLEFL